MSKPLLCLLWSLWVLSIAPQALPQQRTIGLATGDPEGTYYAMGEGMRKLVALYGITLHVLPSAGAGANVWATYKDPYVQLGITQADVLNFIHAVADATQPLPPEMQGTKAQLRELEKAIRIVFPLFNAEVHLVAWDPKIQSLPDLQGKTVAIGPQGSGTSFTAQRVFYYAQVQADLRFIEVKEALNQFRAKKVDAIFYVSGYPIRLFQEAVFPTEKPHLIPVDDPRITQAYPYPKVSIPTGKYAWQDKAVQTIAVPEILITFDYKIQGMRCATVGLVANIVQKGVGWLQQYGGHDKWQDVHFNDPVRFQVLKESWHQASCVTKALQRALPEKVTPFPNPIVEALRQIRLGYSP